MARPDLSRVRSLIDRHIAHIKRGDLTREDFLSPESIKTEEDVERLNLYRMLNDQATILKRKGELAKANELYMKSLEVMPRYDAQVIWGWAKVFLLAKQWEDASKLLEMYQMLMVSWCRLMRAEGNDRYFEDIRRFGVVPSFDFAYEPGASIRDVMGHPMMDVVSARDKIATYGGSPYWENNFTLSESEFQSFIRTFPVPSI